MKLIFSKKNAFALGVILCVGLFVVLSNAESLLRGSRNVHTDFYDNPNLRVEEGSDIEYEKYNPVEEEEEEGEQEQEQEWYGNVDDEEEEKYYMQYLRGRVHYDDLDGEDYEDHLLLEPERSRDLKGGHGGGGGYKGRKQGGGGGGYGYKGLKYGGGGGYGYKGPKYGGGGGGYYRGGRRGYIFV